MTGRNKGNNKGTSSPVMSEDSRAQGGCVACLGSWSSYAEWEFPLKWSLLSWMEAWQDSESSKGRLLKTQETNNSGVSGCSWNLPDAQGFSLLQPLSCMSLVQRALRVCLSWIITHAGTSFWWPCPHTRHATPTNSLVQIRHFIYFGLYMSPQEECHMLLYSPFFHFQTCSLLPKVR